MSFEISAYLLTVICFFTVLVATVLVAIGLGIAGWRLTKENKHLQRQIGRAFFVEDFSEPLKVVKKVHSVAPDIYGHFTRTLAKEIIDQNPRYWADYFISQHYFEMCEEFGENR